MTLTAIDWLVIGAYFALNLAIGLYYARRARGSTAEFFLSGRNVPWWLAGTSMVATTIAGLWGVLLTDLVQFVLKMGMVIALAYYAVRAVGGLCELEAKVRALDAAAGSRSRLAFFPTAGSAWMPAITLFVYLGVIVTGAGTGTVLLLRWSGGGSMPGRRFLRWPSLQWSRCICSSG